MSWIKSSQRLNKNSDRTLIIPNMYENKNNQTHLGTVTFLRLETNSPVFSTCFRIK